MLATLAIPAIVGRLARGKGSGGGAAGGASKISTNPASGLRSMESTHSRCFDAPGRAGLVVEARPGKGNRHRTPDSSPNANQNVAHHHHRVRQPGAVRPVGVRGWPTDGGHGIPLTSGHTRGFCDTFYQCDSARAGLSPCADNGWLESSGKPSLDCAASPGARVPLTPNFKTIACAAVRVTRSTRLNFDVFVGIGMIGGRMRRNRHWQVVDQVEESQVDIPRHFPRCVGGREGADRPYLVSGVDVSRYNAFDTYRPSIGRSS